MNTRALVACLVGACIAAGCSSGGSSTPPATTALASTAPSTETTTDPTATKPTATTAPTTTPTSTTTASTTTTQPTAGTSTSVLTDEQVADIALARTALLTLEVFPQGWVEEPADDIQIEIGSIFERRFDECLGRPPDSVTDQLDDLEAESGDFTAPGDNPPSVQHSVIVAPDEATAVLAMSELALEDASECLEDVVRDFFEAQLAANPDVPPDLRIGEVAFDRVDTGEPPFRSLGYEVVVPLELGEQRSAQYLELLYHRRGRALSSLEFSSFGEPFDRDEYFALSDEAAARIAAIGG